MSTSVLTAVVARVVAACTSCQRTDVKVFRVGQCRSCYRKLAERRVFGAKRLRRYVARLTDDERALLRRILGDAPVCR